MQAYLAKRLLLVIPTLVGMSIFVFVMLRLAPGNIADVLFASAGYVDPAGRERIIHELGLDRPIVVQYVQWVRSVLQGDLGTSYRYNRPAWEIVKGRIPVTLQLAVMATLFSLALGIPLGIVSAIRQDSWLDYLVRVISLAGLSMPAFWLGFLVLLVLVRGLHWIPPMTYVSPFEDLPRNLSQFVWPALVVGYRSSALLMRITRSAFLDVLREDYIRTARAKGLRERLVILRHALRNAILPVITVIGVEFAFMIGGLVVTETVFNLPGVARYLVEAILWRDYVIVQNLVLFIMLVVVLANLAVDLAYAWLDPRIRYA